MREVAFEKKDCYCKPIESKACISKERCGCACGFPPNLFLADATNHHHPLELVLANNSKSFQLISN